MIYGRLYWSTFWKTENKASRREMLSHHAVKLLLNSRPLADWLAGRIDEILMAIQWVLAVV